MQGNPTHSVFPAASRRLVFVSGKGGVGKTAVSQALAELHARRGKRTLWATFEDPSLPPGARAAGPNLTHLNCDSWSAFQEYAALKIGVPLLAKVFLSNKLIRYLAKAAPGIHELVLIGKVWHERENYDRVIVDMPSTGHGLAMFQSTENFSNLFKGGPLAKDALAMLATFNDPRECGHLVIGLPEETPLVECRELREYLQRIFPANPPELVVNRMFPGEAPAADPREWPTPYAESLADYARKRVQLEAFNLRAWSDLDFRRLPLVPADSERRTVERLARELEGAGWT